MTSIIIGQNVTWGKKNLKALLYFFQHLHIIVGQTEQWMKTNLKLSCNKAGKGVSSKTDAWVQSLDPQSGWGEPTP